MINRVLSATRQYCAADYAFFKIFMVALGVLLGIYFAPYLYQYLTIIWVVVIVAGGVTIGRLLYLIFAAR